jgi:membrane protein YqaA with SNARE-associated domain
MYAPIDSEGRVTFLNRLNKYLIIMGIPGLFAISFLDSAGIPLFGGPDALIMLFAWRSPSMTHWIILAATVGSTLGCLVLYSIGRKGGEKALSRLNPERAARIERKMQKYGIGAIVFSVFAPPPFPTKLAIIAAGVLRMGKARLAAGVFIGRLIRYSIAGFLAARFGDQAALVIKKHTLGFFLVVIISILLAILIRSLKKRFAVFGG